MPSAVLEIMFPPKEGYLFGTDVEPFLQVYVQNSANSLAIAGCAYKEIEIYSFHKKDM